jgi:aldose 1-epimerase
MKDAKYHFNNKTYTIQNFLLGSSAIHGLLYDVPFTVRQTWADEKTAGVSLHYAYNGTDAGYPFNYDCELVYELNTANALTLITTISNKDHHAIPMQDGWHPYFSFGGTVNELELQFNGDTIAEFDEALIPTGKFLPYTEFNSFKKIGNSFFDNCFVLQPDGGQQPACILKDAAQQLQLEIYPEKNYPCLQIYTPPHRNSIAIENLSAIPDAFNNGMGLIILQPQSSAQFVTTYKISSLS